MSISGSPATRYCSDAQAPRSLVLHRSEQNGRNFAAGVHSTGFLQRGQLTILGLMFNTSGSDWSFDSARQASSCGHLISERSQLRRFRAACIEHGKASTHLVSCCANRTQQVSTQLAFAAIQHRYSGFLRLVQNAAASTQSTCGGCRTHAPTQSASHQTHSRQVGACLLRGYTSGRSGRLQVRRSVPIEFQISRRIEEC